MGYCIDQHDSNFHVFAEKAESFPKLEFWEWKKDKNGSITKFYFAAEKGGWGEEEELQKIAPLVEDGSWIEMHGEDGDVWRYVFNQGKMKVVHPKISWE